MSSDDFPPISVCRKCGVVTHHCPCEAGDIGDEVRVVPDAIAAEIREHLRDRPELKKDEYETENPQSLDGHCYVAAEAYYHVTDRELDVYCLSWSDGSTHWYLREVDEGRFIDLVLPLSTRVKVPPYEEGVRRAFITGYEPSERAENVVQAIR